MSDLPMAKQKCGNCRFWCKVRVDEDESSCTRYPPVFIAATDDDDDVPFSHSWNLDSWAWPYTHRSSWCGEWNPCDEPTGEAK